MAERKSFQMRLAPRGSTSDVVILGLSVAMLATALGSAYLADGAVAVVFLVGLPVLTGVSWYTALKDARSEPMPAPTAAFSALGASVVLSFITIFIGSFGAIITVVGVLAALGTERGLSLVRASASVPLLVLLVFAAINGSL